MITPDPPPACLKPSPIGKDVGRDEIDRGGEFRVLEPNVPIRPISVTGHVTVPCDALDELDQVSISARRGRCFVAGRRCR